MKTCSNKWHEDCVLRGIACNECQYQDGWKPRRNMYMSYTPVCPRGYGDCVCDPAYIKKYSPDWYKDLYGDLTPEEAILVEGGCMERTLNDPEMNYYCYDDEDK